VKNTPAYSVSASIMVKKVYNIGLSSSDQPFTKSGWPSGVKFIKHFLFLISRMRQNKLECSSLIVFYVSLIFLGMVRCLLIKLHIGASITHKYFISGQKLRTNTLAYFTEYSVAKIKKVL